MTWGYNNNGQLGQGNTTSGSLPGYVVDEEGRFITNIKQIAAGDSHMLAVTNDGEVYSWGLNRYGDLGYGGANTTASNVNGRKTYAVKVLTNLEDPDDDGNYPTLKGIKQVSAGIEFSVAVANDGTVYSWGLGTTGQLGNGGKANSYYPVVANITDVEKVDCRRIIYTSINKR